VGRRGDGKRSDLLFYLGIGRMIREKCIIGGNDREAFVGLKADNERLLRENESLVLEAARLRKENRNFSEEFGRRFREGEEELKRRTDELASVSRELESFSYSVAHDLRNPLQIIKSAADFLKNDCDGLIRGECMDYIGMIKDGAARLNSIVDDMLMLSRISRQEMDCVEIDLGKMARLTIEDLRRTRPERSVEISINEGLKVRADIRLMSAVMGNLLGNAWKYTSKTDRARIELAAFELRGERVYYIRDNGAGFDMKLAGKLFMPFSRLHPEREFSGAGIGLAVAKRAIGRHGGRIWAEGEPGKGATFYFTLRQ
jgi:light-regulated signal transduction histidine kinase (bacteriophytochrome)